jgi:hypothetical protein
VLLLVLLVVLVVLVLLLVLPQLAAILLPAGPAATHGHLGC